MILQNEIRNMKAGETVQGVYLIKSFEIKQGNNNKFYLDINIGDKTGEINCKHWDYTEGMENEFQTGKLIKVRGSITEWQGRAQMKIDKLRIATEDDGVNINDLVAAAPYDAEYMWTEILTYIEKIEDEEIKSIVLCIFEDGQEKLMYYPAAKKNHHSIRSGLLYHILTMLKSGEKLMEIYTGLNSDLLYAGVILHDFAKIYEMNSDEMGIVSDYTVEGNLLGHIITGIKLIENAARDLGINPEKSMVLQHMILTHHYEAEYGSPMKPKIPEAEMLHYLDIIDARMFDIKKAMDGVEDGKFGERIWSLENRAFYKPNF